ncbi:MAG: hypothetical protein ABEL51_05825 [Salinibacter sp.]
MHVYPRYGLADLIASSGAEVPRVEGLGDEYRRGTALKDVDREAVTEGATELAAHYLTHKLRVYGPPEQDTPGTEGVLSEVESEVGQTSDGGYYTRPHALVEAGGSLNSAIKSPTPGKRLLKGHCPFASKMSIGQASAANPKMGTAFTALSQVATYTPNKIAIRWPGTDDRLALLPDLPLDDLVTFVRFYRTYVRPQVDLLGARVTESGNWRLHCNSGTYPDPAPAWAFGALGLTAGLVRWAERLGYLQRAEALLRAIDRVYVVGTKTKYQEVEPLDNHVIRLARGGTLWRLLQDAEAADPDRDPSERTDPDELTPFRLFLRRWLTTFSRHHFERFLSVRARYPSSFHPAFNQYFAMSHDDALIEAAKAAGHHVSAQAYAAADGDTEEANKILNSIESRLVEATDESEMIASLTTRVGRLTGSMFDPDAVPFLDAVQSEGPPTLDEARNLLMAYMRVFPEKHADDGETETTDGAEEGADDSTSDNTPDGGVSPEQPDSGDALKV